jgi:hypothetical protein
MQNLFRFFYAAKWLDTSRICLKVFCALYGRTNFRYAKSESAREMGKEEVSKRGGLSYFWRLCGKREAYEITKIN